jgi:hypothetical protein
LYNYSQTYAWDVDWIGATVEKRTYNLWLICLKFSVNDLILYFK